MREMESYEMLLEQMKQYDEAEERKQDEECKKKREYMQTLKMQMEGVDSKKAKKLEEFMEDKKIIDEIIDKIQQEEIQYDASKQNHYKFFLLITLHKSRIIYRTTKSGSSWNLLYGTS